MLPRTIPLEALPPLSEEWLALVQQLVDHYPEGSIYLLGPPDTGKTTLALHLVALLSRHTLVAYLDGDPGQSNLGLPSTVALGLVGPATERVLQTRALMFVGNVSPRGHLLQTISGLLLLQRLALRLGARVCVIDGCGFVRGQPAEEFQVNLIHLLHPDQLIALQADRELEPIVRNFTRHPDTHLHVWSPSPRTRQRSYLERQAYRKELFARYFHKATLQEVPWRDLGLHGMIPNFGNPLSYGHRLVALCDAEKLVVALALVERWEENSRLALLLAPPFAVERVATIQFGSLRLSPAEL